MLHKLVKTDSDYALTISRLVLGSVFFAHGAQLLLGWFGGYGLTGSMQFFTQRLEIPAAFAFLAICVQFFGGLMLILGFAGRIAAIGIICDMAVAVIKVHWQFGFFMNWFGTQKGEGFDNHLLAIALGLVVVLRGSGAVSLDRLLVRVVSSAEEKGERIQRQDVEFDSPPTPTPFSNRAGHEHGAWRIKDI